MHKIHSYIPLLLLALVACAAPRPAPTDPMGVEFLPERGEFVAVDGSRTSLEGILELARGAEYLLMGEGHANRCDHAVQHLLVAGLARSGMGEGGQPPAVGLEMVGSDLQPVLDRFNAGRMELEELEEALSWRTNWGYPFELFEPLFVLAREQGLPVAALNAPRPLVKAVSRDGLDALPPEDRARLPEVIVPPLEEQRAELERIFALHEQQEHGSGELDRFLAVQSLWDTAMAENAVALRRRTGRPVVAIAGSGHVERGWGIAHRLRSLDPRADIVLLMPLRDTFAYAPEDGDAFFYCPDEFQSRMGVVLEAREGRVVVTAVRRGSRADEKGIRPGDELVRAQGRPLDSFLDLHLAGRRAHEADEPLELVVARRGERLAVNLGKLGKGPTKQGE